jgi:hypothetical protein
MQQRSRRWQHPLLMILFQHPNSANDVSTVQCSAILAIQIIYNDRSEPQLWIDGWMNSIANFFLIFNSTAAAKSLLKRPNRTSHPTFHSSRSATNTSPLVPPQPQAAKDDQDKAPLPKMYAKKKTPPKKKATPKKKASTPAKSTTPRAGAPPIWEGKPDELLEGGWPAGWIKRVFERKGGATKGQTDRYWYSPISAFKLRSMVEVKKFIAALRATNGDEKTAKATMRNY